MNFRKTIAQIIYSLLVSFLLISCNKKTEQVHFIIPDEMKQWYLYQKGSYWIFQNETNQHTDSTYINKDPEFWQERNGENADGSFSDLIDHIGYSFNNSFLKGCDIISWECEFYPFLDLGTYAFMSFINEGQKFRGDGFLFEYIQHFDSISINNNIFKNVRRTKLSVRSNGDTLAFTYYFARNIGLIKYIKSYTGIDSSWSLLRWHPVQ